jgi:predicted nucleic acid-binding OB-fold protein
VNCLGESCYYFRRKNITNKFFTYKTIENSNEEYAYVLDFLPNGHPDDTRPMYPKKPIFKGVGEKNFVFLEMIPKNTQRVAR